MIKIKLSKRQIQGGIVLLLLLPPIITAVYIAMFGVNVIFWDQWRFLEETLSHWYNGTLSFQDLFAQHNEHRLFFPRLLMIGIAVVTSYNNIAEMACSCLLLILNLVLIYKIYLNGKKWSWEYLMYFIPAAWLVCSIHQVENLLWGFQISIFLCVTGFLLAILFLERCKGIDGNLAAGIFGGILSTFSFLNGLLVWPAGLVLLLLKEKRDSRVIIGWLIAATVTILTFFYGWELIKSHPYPFYFLSEPVEAIEYFLIVTANSFGFRMQRIGEYYAMIGGIIFLLIFGFVIYRAYYVGIIRTHAGIIALIVFGLMSEVMITAGRAGLGLIQAGVDKYVTLTVIGVIGIYLLFIHLKEFYKDDIWIKRVFYLFCILIFAGIILGMVDGFIAGTAMKDQREQIRGSLIFYQTASDSDLSKTWQDPNFVREWTPFLKQHKLNVFTGSKDVFPDLSDRLYSQFYIDIINPVGTSRQTHVNYTFKSIAGEIKPTIFEQSRKGGSQIYVNCPLITRNSSLTFGIALDSKIWSPDKGDGVEYQIYINSKTPQNLIFSKYIDPKHNPDERKWNEYNVNLSRYEGQNITLIFSTSPGPKNDPSYDWAWWGDPRITFAKE